MRNVSDEEGKIVPIVGTIWGIAVIGAVICGILECFRVRTGTIGGIVSVISILPLPLMVLFFLLCYIMRRINPEWDKDKVERLSVYIILFLLVSILLAIFI